MQDPVIEKVLGDRKIGWKYVPEMPVEQLSPNRNFQVRRTVEGKVNETEARQYTQLIVAGADLGPLVVAEGTTPDQFYIIEGNTRREALRRAKRPVWPVYIVSIKSATAARTLSLELNCRFGKRMTNAEIQDYIRNQNGQLPTADELIKITGRTKSFLLTAIAAKKFDDRCAALKLEVLGDLPVSVKALILQVQLNEVFLDLVALAGDAGLTVANVRTIVHNIATAGSANAQKDIIREARTFYQPVIEERKFGIHGKSVLWTQQLAMHVGWFRNQLDAGTLNDRNPDTRDKTHILLQRASEYISRALTGYSDMG